MAAWWLMVKHAAKHTHCTTFGKVWLHVTLLQQCWFSLNTTHLLSLPQELLCLLASWHLALLFQHTAWSMGERGQAGGFPSTCVANRRSPWLCPLVGRWFTESWPFTFSSQCRGKAESLLTLDADWPFSCFVMAIDPTLEVSWERLRNLISSVYICVITAGEENSQVTDTYLSSAEGAHLQLTPLERMTHQEMVQTSRLSPSFDPQQILQLLSVKQSCRYFSALSCYWSLASKEVHGKPHWKHSRVISTCSAAVHCEKSLPSGTAAPRTSSTGSLSQSELSDVSKGISSLEEPKVWDQRCPFTSAVPLDTESNDEVCDYSVPCTPWTLRTVTLV